MAATREPAAPRIGDTITFRKTMTAAEQALFTGISGNLGGLYVDRTRARAEGLADMAVFEMAASSLLSTCLARLAGPGHRIASLSLAFEQPICVGVTVEARATLSAVEAGALSFTLACEADGRGYASGAAVLVPVAGG